MVDKVVINDEGNIFEVVQGNDLTVCRIIESDIEIEKLSFLQLNDTPSSYEGFENYNLAVNEDASGVVFRLARDSFISLNDTPNNYDDSAYKLLAVNSNSTGITFLNYTVGDINIEYFTQLADVPSNYTGANGKILSVKNTEDGIEFNSFNDLMPNQSITSGSYLYPQIVVNDKGLITAIQEGSPYIYDPFEANRILVGDGTSVPVQIQLGNLNQTLVTGSNNTPTWIYQNSLYKDGYLLLTASYDDTQSTFIPLNIYASNNSTKLYVDDNGSSFILGKFNELTVQNRNTTITGTLAFNNTGNSEIISNSSLNINPTSGTVGISNSIDPFTYANRIVNDNDFITRRWFLLNSAGSTDKKLIKTNSASLASNTVTFNIPSGATLYNVSLSISQGFNEEAELQITDSSSSALILADDCPALDNNDEVKIFLPSITVTGIYSISISFTNYQYGYAEVYISYFN